VRPVPWVWAAVLAAVLATTGAPAQTVVLEGGADAAVDRRLERILAASPVIITRDTLLAREDTVRGPVLVLGAELVMEGVILGDLVLVDAAGFIRPTAEVTGDLVNIAGGLYRSELATVGGEIVDLPVAAYALVREADRWVIRATDVPSALALHGVLGFHVPTYDRVNGLTLIWGAGYRAPILKRVGAEIHGQVGWQTQRGDPTHALWVDVGERDAGLSFGHERAWDTRERWIRGDLLNSLAYLWHGQDLRDYHEVDRTWVRATRLLTEGRLTARGELTGQVEDARSLRAGEPWFLWGSATRPNPPVDDGRISSALGALDVEWEGRQTLGLARVEAEGAGDWLGGEHRFGRLTVHGRWAMAALANHSLSVDAFLQGPLGANPLPRQRWSFVGGPATLHTLDVAEFRGDRVVFTDTRYIIPLPDRLTLLTLLGAPRLHLVHAAGMAWTAPERPALHQEVGVLLDLSLLHIRFVLVPDDPSQRHFGVSLAFPVGRTFHWER
jgi:hypothetical protein